MRKKRKLLGLKKFKIASLDYLYILGKGGNEGGDDDDDDDGGDTKVVSKFQICLSDKKDGKICFTD